MRACNQSIGCTWLHGQDGQVTIARSGHSQVHVGMRGYAHYLPGQRDHFCCWGLGSLSEERIPFIARVGARPCIRLLAACGRDGICNVKRAVRISVLVVILHRAAGEGRRAEVEHEQRSLVPGGHAIPVATTAPACLVAVPHCSEGRKHVKFQNNLLLQALA